MRHTLFALLTLFAIACTFRTSPQPQAAATCADGPPMCSQDLRAVIQCQGGVWRMLDACHGPRGCGFAGSALQCDRGSAPAPGPAPGASAPCAEGGYDCAPDRRSLLVCRGSRWTVASSCRGTRGCSVGAAVACDHSVAAPGDPCDEPNATACGTDGKQLLRCANGTFVYAEACPNACLATSGRVLCQ